MLGLPKVKFEKLARPALALVFLFGVPLATGATLTHPAPAVQPAGEAGSALPTLVQHYETPCYYRERTARGIPALAANGGGLLAWERAHAGTPEAADWHRAVANCRANEPVGKWDWDAMILVGTEELR